MGTSYESHYGGCRAWAAAPNLYGAGKLPVTDSYQEGAKFPERLRAEERVKTYGTINVPVWHERLLAAERRREAERKKPQATKRRALSAGIGPRQSRIGGGTKYVSKTTYNPFETTENPAGKYCSFPVHITPVLPIPADPLGFTPLHGKPAGSGHEDRGSVPWGAVPSAFRQHHLNVDSRENDPEAPRSRHSRYPPGGYPEDMVPFLRTISKTPDDPPNWLEYRHMEDPHRGGRGCKFPHDLDPYPSYRK